MSFDKGQVVLVDTNVIIEAHRLGCWNSLADFFNLETVEKCVEETQTGFQRRTPEEIIDSANLRKTLSSIHPVSDIEILSFTLEHESAAILDPGEQHLIIHSTKREDAWVVNTPDKAAMRFIYEMGWSDRLVSLESMANRISAHMSSPLRDNFSESWLQQKKAELLLDML